MKNIAATNPASRVLGIFCIFALLIMMMSCGGAKTSYIFILDLTESVSAEARTKSFETIKTRAKLLKRGDSLTVIPLTSDAQVETSGKVLHLEVSEKREIADADLDEFLTDAEQQLNEMQKTVKSYIQSDILGALRVAREEIAMTNSDEKRVVVIVLSDMVQSTKQVRFESDINLAKTEAAVKYAKNLAENSSDAFKNSEIYIGFLESSDLRKMSEDRRESVRKFWEEYFKLSSAKRVQLATDGTGQLEKFIEQRDKF